MSAFREAILMGAAFIAIGAVAVMAERYIKRKKQIPEITDSARLDWLEKLGRDHGWTDEGRIVLYIDEEFSFPLRDAIDERMREEGKT